MDIGSVLGNGLSADPGLRREAEEILGQAADAQKHQVGPGALAVSLVEFLHRKQEPGEPQDDLNRMAAFLLRRVVLERDDQEVLKMLFFQGDCLLVKEGKVQNALAQVISTLITRGSSNSQDGSRGGGNGTSKSSSDNSSNDVINNNGSNNNRLNDSGGRKVKKRLDRINASIQGKLDLFLRFAGLCSETDKLVGMILCIKCVKIIAMNASKVVDDSSIDFPAVLSPILGLVVGPNKREMLCSPAHVARVACAMRKFAEYSYYVSNSSIPDWWLSSLLQIAKSMDCVHVQCEIAMALRSISRHLRHRQDLRPCFEYCMETLRIAVYMKYPPDSDDGMYDSDDGEPRGLSALITACMDAVHYLFPHSSLTRKEKLDKVNDLVKYCIQGCRLTPDVQALFVHDPNEFVALHEDENAAHFPRQAAPTLLEQLAVAMPRELLDSFINYFQELPMDGNSDYSESALWLVGNLNLLLSEDGDLDLLEKLKTELMQPFLTQLIGMNAQLHPFLKARVLWAIWACWCPEWVNSEMIWSYIATNLAEASSSARPSLLQPSSSISLGEVSNENMVIGLYACRAFARFIGHKLQNSEHGLNEQDQLVLFRGLMETLRSSEPETVHIPLESLYVFLELLNESPSRLQLLVRSGMIRDLLGLLTQLWNHGIEYDPLLRDNVTSILCDLLINTKEAWIIETLFTQAPDLLVIVFDSFTRNERLSEQMLLVIRKIVIHLEKSLLNNNNNNNNNGSTNNNSNNGTNSTTIMEMDIDQLNQFRSCSRLLHLNDIEAQRQNQCYELPILNHLYGHLENVDDEELLLVGNSLLLDVLRAARFTNSKGLLCELGQAIFMVSILHFNHEVLLNEIALCCVLMDGIDWILKNPHLKMNDVSEFVKHVYNRCATDQTKALGALTVYILNYFAATRNNCTHEMPDMTQTLKKILKNEDPIQRVDSLDRQNSHHLQTIVNGGDFGGVCESDLWSFGGGGILDDMDDPSDETTSACYLSEEQKELYLSKATHVIEKFFFNNNNNS